jgi:phenylpyruvate tautomerase PptA (4-oxalocrotonate tautomerase family)
MPLLRLTTNKPLPDAQQQSITKVLSSSVASMLGKPESYVMVIVQHNAAMLFAGTDEPSAYLELKSLGLPEVKTAEYSATLCKLLYEQLAIDSNRIYIEFASPPRHFWGWNSTTF